MSLSILLFLHLMNRLDYFGNEACLAQSPQFYKQMSTACADFERVFEVGPVFRAENSNTHRHLCEFTGLDLEMTIKEHYHEALNLIADMFVYIFDGLNEHYQKELAAVNVSISQLVNNQTQHPFTPLVYPKKTLIIPYTEGMQLLIDNGFDVDPMGDLRY